MIDPGGVQPARARPRGLRGWRPPSRSDVIARLDARRPAAGDHVRVQPGRLRRRGPAVRARRACGSPTRTSARRSTRSSTNARRTSRPRISRCCGYWDWRDGLRRGVAAHHAGLVPPFKETVEELFVRGLVKAVFATETLALGINMPARTVVLERLTKFNGETHADLTPGEYTQLTGRAGRRGIDIEGHAVVLWGPEVDPAASPGWPRRAPIRCARRSGRPTTWRSISSARWDAAPARQLLESSFAQFQADRGVAGSRSRSAATRRRCAEYDQQLTCHLGDIDEYAALRRALTDREAELSRQGARARKAAVAQSLEALRPGDVIRVPAGREPAWPSSLDPGLSPRDDPHPLVVTEARWAGRVSIIDFPVTADVLGHVRVPKQRRPPLAAGAPRSRVEPARARPAAREPAGAGARATAATRTPRCCGCAPRCAPTRVTAATTASSTCAGPSGTPASSATPTTCAGASRDAPARWAAASTGSAGCSTARLPRRGRDDAGRAAARPDLVRERPGHRRVPARRRVGRAGAGRAGRRRVDAGVRAAPRRARGRPDAQRRRARRAGDDRADLGAGRRRRGRARPDAEPRTGAGPGVGAVPVGARRAARSRAGGRGARPARSCRRATSCAGASRCSTCSSSSPTSAARTASPSRSRHRARGCGSGPARRGRAEHAAVKAVHRRG